MLVIVVSCWEMSSGDAEESIQALLTSVERLLPRFKGREGDLSFLSNVLRSNEFHSLMKVHQEVSSATSVAPSPVTPSALTLAHMVAYDLEGCDSPEAQELFDLITSPHVDAVISSHDRVANKEYPIQSVAMETSGGRIDEKPVQFVRIEKRTDPLGATVKRAKDGSTSISRVLCGGAADRSGLLHPGDVIHEINGKSIMGFSLDDVADLMKGLTGTVVFKITPAMSQHRPRRRHQPPVYMRTLFPYHPLEDGHNPCPEAGLGFRIGTILQVVNQDDPDWWQAVKEGDRSQRAGLVPSKKLRERLEYLELYGNQKQRQQRRRGKTKKIMYSSYESEVSTQFGKEVVTYEEVVKVEAQVDRPRPILLIAPTGGLFDVDALKRRLIREKPQSFAAPVAHTSRPPRANEMNGQQYLFISKHQMEQDIQNNRFVEHGFLDGHYYGTSINSVRSVINSGRTCVLTLAFQAMKLVRTPELKPFIVYFEPPTADYMRQNWVSKGRARESSIADILRQAAYLEKTYCHYFDHILPFTDLDAAYTELLRVTDRLLQDQQWVPATWANK